MAKKKILNLTVPEPCPRKWDDMTQTDMGRHCAGCDKTLTDFSSYSDKQLVEFFSKAKHGLCGMFNNDQLNRTIVIPAENNSFIHKALLGTALVAGLSASANAQVNSQSMPAMQVPLPVTPASVNETIKQRVIHGKLIDKKTKEPIEYADLYITEIDSFLETDTSGIFEIVIPDNYKGTSITVGTDITWYHNVTQTVDLTGPKSDILIEIKRKHHLFRKHRTFRTIGCPSF